MTNSRQKLYNRELENNRRMKALEDDITKVYLTDEELLQYDDEHMTDYERKVYETLKDKVDDDIVMYNSLHVYVDYKLQCFTIVTKNASIFKIAVRFDEDMYDAYEGIIDNYYYYLLDHYRFTLKEIRKHDNKILMIK
jgi:hypothetical protein